MASVINPNSAVPLYKQIANIIAQDIKNGKYSYGDRLPSELTLKDVFGSQPHYRTCSHCRTY